MDNHPLGDKLYSSIALAQARVGKHTIQSYQTKMNRKKIINVTKANIYLKKHLIKTFKKRYTWYMILLELRNDFIFNRYGFITYKSILRLKTMI